MYVGYPAARARGSRSHGIHRTHAAPEHCERQRYSSQGPADCPRNYLAGGQPEGMLPLITLLRPEADGMCSVEQGGGGDKTAATDILDTNGYAATCHGP